MINWIRQRSRWYKGYLQTQIVHMRKPQLLVRQIGLKATLRLVNMTGAIPLSNAVNIILWSIMLVWLVGHPQAVSMLFPPITYYVCPTLFLLAAPLSIYVGLVVTVALGKPHLWWAAVLVPGIGCCSRSRRSRRSTSCSSVRSIGRKPSTAAAPRGRRRQGA